MKWRNVGLTNALIGYVFDAEEPVPWNELLETFTTEERSWKTVENRIYDLVAFGAFHRIGKPAERRRPDTRALKATVLGRAWLERELVPLPTDEIDPLEAADEIAERLGAEFLEE